jgi:Bacterial protein of unknown function (DUF903)
MTVLRALFCLSLLACLCQCQGSGPNYKITLKDGREYLCKGCPELMRKTGYYRYQTHQDRKALLRADEVLMVEELDT